MTASIWLARSRHRQLSNEEIAATLPLNWFFGWHKCSNGARFSIGEPCKGTDIVLKRILETLKDRGCSGGLEPRLYRHFILQNLIILAQLVFVSAMIVYTATSSDWQIAIGWSVLLLAIWYGWKKLF